MKLYRKTSQIWNHVLGDEVASTRLPPRVSSIFPLSHVVLEDPKELTQRCQGFVKSGIKEDDCRLLKVHKA